MFASSRHFANNKKPTRTSDDHQELLTSLTRINAYNPPVQTCSTGWHFHGLYAGPTSIAYLFYRLSLIYPDLEFKDQSLIDWAHAYLQLSNQVSKRAPNPSHCGIANETLAYFTLNSILLNDSSLANKVCSFEPVINAVGDDGSNEWLYGRAGYLYFLRMCSVVFKAEDHPSTAKLLTQSIDKTVTRILSVQQPWIWHDKHYIGAAHGTIGIICQIVLSKPEAAPTLQPLLSSLLDQQLESGNFPSSLPTGVDRLVQFCHGGPGFIISLRSLLPHFSELQPKIQQAIERARADIWKRGILRKEPSLCHGVPGNALSFDDQRQFDHFLAFMTTDSMEQVGWMRDAGRNDEFAGLYTGEAGRAWLWAIADQNLAKTCIGYNDI